ncbi:MAG TPA: SRPBCC domain-containing protein [Burkholderiaceae bacterium]|nr:SRPBCC domain-containing protein [Burkholderiaceae bacterium]
MSAFRNTIRRGLASWLAAAALGAAAQNAPSPVTTTMLPEPGGLQALAQSVEIAAPPPAVWEALSTSAGWRSWAAPFAEVDFRLGGTIETSYQAGARAGAPGNIRNQIVAYVPQRLLAIRNVQAPPNTPFDAAAFQTLHTAVLLDAIDGGRTRVTTVMSGVRSGEPWDGVLKHFRWGNAWTLEKLKERFEKGPVDWARLMAPRAASAAAPQ